MPTLKFHVVVGRCRLTPVGTGVSLEEGATSTKKIPSREVGSKGGLGRDTAYKVDCLRLSAFAHGCKVGAMPSRGSQHSRISGWALRGGLGKVRIGGIRYVLVSRGVE